MNYGNKMPQEKCPVLSVQCDWDEVLRKSGGKVWVSYKYKDEKSREGVIKNISNSEKPKITISDGFNVHAISKDVIEVYLLNSPFSTLFLAPMRIYKSIHSKSIVSLSVTTTGLAVSACAENTLKIWNVNHGDIKFELNGHMGSVYKCRFFPSEQVVLSCGSDMQIKIWSGENGTCPVSLVGHKMAVTDIAIIERGRNIISVSKDGTAKLWHCGESKCLADILHTSSSINCCKINISSLELEDGVVPGSDLMFGCDNKVVLIGCEDGSVFCVAVKSKKILFTLTHNSAVNCVTYVSVDKFLVGCQDGRILLYDVNVLTEPINEWFESNSPVLSLLEFREIGFFSARADGTVTFRNIKNNPKCLALTGPNYDPVYDLSSDGKFLYTCCRDSIIRKYLVLPVINAFF